MSKIKEFMAKEEMEVVLKKVAKGSIQKWILEDLIEKGKTDQLQSYIKTHRYYNRYMDGFGNLMERLEKFFENKYPHLKVKYEAGKLGGRCTGYYTLERAV